METVKVSEAIEARIKVIKGMKEMEEKGKIFGFSAIQQRSIEELKKLQKDLKKYRNNENFCAHTLDGYINLIQNQLFHAKHILGAGHLEGKSEEELIDTVKDARKRLDGIYDEILALFALAKVMNINLVP